MGEPEIRTTSPNPDAERALLGALLTAEDTVLEAVAALEARDFLTREHSIIFQVLRDLNMIGGIVDIEVAANNLDRNGQLEEIGGKEYLQEILLEACAPWQIEQTVDVVRGNGLLRRLEQAGGQIAAEARAAGPSDAEDILALAARHLESVGAGRDPEAFAPLADIIEDALDEIEHISNRSGQMTGVPTGFADFDSLTQGLQPGQLIVIAGRPGIGKSTLGLDLARSCSIRKGLTSVIFSLDMRRNEIAMRLNSAEARVALHHMRSGNMTDDDWARLARRMGEVSAAPLFVDDTADLTFTQIRARCRRLRRKHDLRLAIVDTINMMTYGTRPFDNRYLEISEIARCLKQLAKELGIPIVAISQLNRGPEQRSDKRPMLHDLRDAGTLEDNADVVVLLHREAAYEAESPRAGEADLIVAKQRQGPTATITVAHQGHYSRFVDMQTN